VAGSSVFASSQNPGARIISFAHRLADIKPDEHIVIDADIGEFDVYLWKAETLRGH
jgi:hypothetical protein